MNTIPELIEDIRNGKMVILVDDEDRENEGDLVLASDFVTPEAINFMATEAKGLICLSLKEEQCKRLKLPMMVVEDANRSPNKTAFTVSIEAARGVSTGISAADRAHTIRVAANPNAQPSDIIMPGHIFPIKAQEGGVLKRAGHTEASVDLSILAGLTPSAVICEIMKPDGSMARVGDLKEFSKKHDIKIGTIEDLISYRLETETLVQETAYCRFPTKISEDFKLRVFKSLLDNTESLVIQKGRINPDETTLVRVHVEDTIGDIFTSLRHDSHWKLEESLKRIASEEAGVLVYLRNPHHESFISDEIRKLSEEDDSLRVPASPPKSRMMDIKDYGIGAQILRAIGVTKINLISNSLSKRVGLKAYGLEIVDETPLFEGASEPGKTHVSMDKNLKKRIEGKDQ